MGQFIYCGKRAQLVPGNCMPLADMPPGTVINNCEKQQGDKGKFAKASGGFAQIIGHIEGADKTRLRMGSRWWQPPAHWPPVDRAPRLRARPKGWLDCGAPHGSAAGTQASGRQGEEVITSNLTLQRSADGLEGQCVTAQLYASEIAVSIMSWYCLLGMVSVVISAASLSQKK